MRQDGSLIDLNSIDSDWMISIASWSNMNDCKDTVFKIHDRMQYQIQDYSLSISRVWGLDEVDQVAKKGRGLISLLNVCQGFCRTKER